MCAQRGTSDPLSRCIIKSKCIGNNAFGDRKSHESHAYYPMECLFEPCKAYKRPCFVYYGCVLSLVRLPCFGQ